MNYYILNKHKIPYIVDFKTFLIIFILYIGWYRKNISEISLKKAGNLMQNKEESNDQI